MSALRRPDPTPAFTDMLGWAVLAGDGVVACRDGTVLAGFWSDPPDASSWEPDAREATSARVNAALRRLGTGWGLWSDCSVVPLADYPPPEASAFPSEAPRAIDEERRRAFTAPGAHLLRDHSVVLGHVPPSAVAGRISDAMRTAEGGEGRRTAHDLAVEALGREADRFEDMAGRALGLRRMQGYLRPDGRGGETHHDELVDYLAHAAHGEHFPLALPRDGGWLEGIVGGQPWDTGDLPRLGRHRIACVSIDGFPAQSFPGILDRLCEMEMPFRLSQRFLFLDTLHADEEIGRYRKGWAQKVFPFVKAALGFQPSRADLDAADKERDADAAAALNKSGKVAFGFYCCTVVLRHESVGALRDMARATERAINDCGYRARLETVNATEAFLATLPGNMRANVRMPPVHTSNLADTVPSSGVWTGAAFAPSPLLPERAPPLAYARTAGGLRFAFNVHSGDNGAHAWFGPPGAGKSTLLNFEANQFLRYPGAKVRGIDVKGGMLVACSAAGGTWREVGGESPAFAPFAHLETSADRLWAAQFVAACFALQHGGRLPEPRQRTAVRAALAILRGQAGLRSVTNFCLAVQDREVRDAMGAYRGGLLDAAAEEAAEGAWDAFDMTAVVHAGSQVLVPAVMCLLRRFDRGIDGAPQLWLMDEVAVQIADPVWEPRLRALLKLYRSRNVAVGLATQNLADMPDALATIVKENVPTLVLGANPAAQVGGAGDERGPADFYRAFGFGRRQREIVRTAEPKRQFYVGQGGEGRLVDFALGPVALALCASTSEADVIRAKAMLAETGPGLPFARGWLKHKGVDHALLG